MIMNKYSIRSIFISLFLIISCFFNIGNSSFVINEESKKEFGVKIGLKSINRMLERPFETDIIKIRYVEGGEMDE